jgi:NAD(P)-dependent dehydrogenase (short-subunit alcohol dehydrogenase family)
MTAQRIALVTGANQGIGYALAEELAARWRPEDLVLLTGRNQSRVTEAAARAAWWCAATIMLVTLRDHVDHQVAYC